MVTSGNVVAHKLARHAQFTISLVVSIHNFIKQDVLVDAHLMAK